MILSDEEKKVTAFIVTPDLPGFEVVSPNRSKMGVRGTWQGTLKFTNMKVPADRVLGQVGKGLKVALSAESAGPGAELNDGLHHDMTRRDFGATALLAAAAAAAVLIALYYVLPVQDRGQPIWWRLTIALAIFVIMLVHELNAILRDNNPMRRAVIAPMYLAGLARAAPTLVRIGAALGAR